LSLNEEGSWASGNALGSAMDELKKAPPGFVELLGGLVVSRVALA